MNFRHPRAFVYDTVYSFYKPEKPGLSRYNNRDSLVRRTDIIRYCFARGPPSASSRARMSYLNRWAYLRRDYGIVRTIIRRINRPMLSRMYTVRCLKRRIRNKSPGTQIAWCRYDVYAFQKIIRHATTNVR